MFNDIIRYTNHRRNGSSQSGLRADQDIVVVYSALNVKRRLETIMSPGRRLCIYLFIYLQYFKRVKIHFAQ